MCKYKNVEIVAGAVCIDHVHLSVAILPKLSVSNFMGYLKGKSTLMIYDRHPEMQSKWDKAFWARGYYVETIGNLRFVRNISALYCSNIEGNDKILLVCLLF